MRYIDNIVIAATTLMSIFFIAQRGEARTITLDEAVITARANSVDAAVALNQLRTSYWSYRTYRADLLPEVTFNATVPSYRKSYSAYQLDDGSFTFVRNNYMQMNGEISVKQCIWLTGGSLSLNTSLDWLRQLDSGTANRFMSVPVALTLNQPIFGVNHVKWNRRIEPIRYEEAKAQFFSSSEQVALSAVGYFFDLLMAKENLGIARQNYANSKKLHEVAIAKREMGQISRNDLLQLELNLLNAESSLTDRESNYRAAMFALKSFLDIEDDEDLEPAVPDEVPAGELNYAEVLDKALANNSFSRQIRRRQLEADYEVARAKGNMRQINLFAQVGFSGTADNANEAYRLLKDNQVVELGFSIPLIDWGKRKGQVKMAENNRKVVESRIRKEQMEFNQDIFILVERYNNQHRQLEISQRADTIAAARYHTNLETFLVGKISTLDLNDSQLSKDESRQAMINQMYLYWRYYYQIRSLTLWDFAKNSGIDSDLVKIIK
ncbi:MAG: TolC family protein [Muribaculaceae bacterium]|nr:TolC family protein [Muribaculaceae bacterium]